MSFFQAPATSLVCSGGPTWVFKELSAPAKYRGIPAVFELLDFYPTFPDSTPCFWTPSLQALRLQKSGAVLPLLSPGPFFMDHVPKAIKKREVETLYFKDLTKDLFPAFAKCAEAKTLFEAKWFSSFEEFLLSARLAKVEDLSLIQLNFSFLNIHSEYRFFTLFDEVLTGSVYKVGEFLFEPLLASHSEADLKGAREFLQGVLSSLSLPPASVLDVGKCLDGSFFLLEANPPWSSSLYGCNPSLCLDALLWSVDYNKQYPDFIWRPDPMQETEAESYAALRKPFVFQKPNLL